MMAGAGPAEKKCILVVEDDRELQDLLSTVLSGDGREVVVAGTAEEGEAVLAGRHVSLVILDLILPDTDGRTLLKRLRARGATANLPVICVSARTGPATHAECYSLGADSFIEKPFDPQVLSSDVALRLQRAAEMEQESHRDGLTGLLNRAGFLDVLEAAAPKGACTLLMAEMDGFRQLSQRYGWGTAERIVYQVSQELRRALGKDVPLCRWGGCEFALLLTGKELGEARAIAEGLLESVRRLPVQGPDGESFRVTLSGGLVSVRKLPVRGPDGESFRVTLSGGLADRSAEDTIEGCVDDAQACLFRARDGGGNRVATPTSEEEEGEDRPVARIIVAEDDDITAKILTHRLAKEGFEVTRFANGQDAYKGALARTPSLVILDVKMPGMDGFEVLERLRKTPAYARVPIVLLTSMGSEADVVRGFDLGADDYVLKPFSPSELLARVRRLLGRGGPARAPVEGNG